MSLTAHHRAEPRHLAPSSSDVAGLHALFASEAEHDNARELSEARRRIERLELDQAQLEAKLAEAKDARALAQQQLGQSREGARALSSIIDRMSRDALAVTGAHDLIDVNGEGDWQGVWKRLTAAGERAVRARVTLADLPVDEPFGDYHTRPSGEIVLGWSAWAQIAVHLNARGDAAPAPAPVSGEGA